MSLDSAGFLEPSLLSDMASMIIVPASRLWYNGPPPLRMNGLVFATASLTRAWPRKLIIVITVAAVVLFLYHVTVNNEPRLSIFEAYDRYRTSPWYMTDETGWKAPDRHRDRYLHQQAVYLPRDAISHRQCDAVTLATLQGLLQLDTTLPLDLNPVAFHYCNGTRLGHEQSFESGEEFCSVVLVPQTRGENKPNQQLPVEGFGPDSIHTEIKSYDVRITFLEPSFWGMLERFSNDSRVRIAIYMFAYALNHPGHYQLQAEVESRHYDWVQEQDINNLQSKLPKDAIKVKVLPRSSTIHITGAPLSRPIDLCYDKGASKDYRGRWYRASSFARNGNQTALNLRTHLEFADHQSTVDEYGWTFAPDNCNLVHFTPQQHMSCLTNRTAQVLGDSNARRMIKTIINGGVNWCQSPGDKACECVDDREQSIQDALNNSITLERFERVEMTDDPTHFGYGNDSKCFFDLVGGLVVPHPGNPWSKYYNHSGFDGSSITERRIARHGAPDVMHISLVDYDAGLLQTTQPLEDALPGFRRTLYGAHPPGTRFVHRLASSMRCSTNFDNCRWNRPRCSIFNHRWREFWAGDEADGRVRVVDPSVLQGRRELETGDLCASPHMHASLVRLEALMWMNAVCDGGEMAGWNHSKWNH